MGRRARSRLHKSTHLLLPEAPPPRRRLRRRLPDLLSACATSEAPYHLVRLPSTGWRCAPRRVAHSQACLRSAARNSQPSQPGRARCAVRPARKCLGEVRGWWSCGGVAQGGGSRHARVAVGGARARAVALRARRRARHRRAHSPVLHLSGSRARAPPQKRAADTRVRATVAAAGCSRQRGSDEERQQQQRDRPATRFVVCARAGAPCLCATEGAELEGCARVRPMCRRASRCLIV